MRGIVIDTNVMSERLKPRPDPKVEAWFAKEKPEDLFLATTVIGELAAGIEKLALGRRRAVLQRWLDTLIRTEFAGKILSFDTEAALIFGRLVAASLAQGRPPGIADAQVAAIAILHDKAVATRDLRGFATFGVPLVSPWET